MIAQVVPARFCEMLYLVSEYGGRLQSQRQAEAEVRLALPERGVVVAGQKREARQVGIGVDGALINIRDEGWKEVKVGVVFDYETVSPDPGPLSLSPADIEERVHTSEHSYCACLGQVEDFEPLQWAEASRRRLPQAWEQVAIGDGAEWIRRLYERHYPAATLVVDWYHAMEHIWRAGRLACGESSPTLPAWVRRRENALWSGQLYQVVDIIRAEAADQTAERAQHLLTEAAYFERNAHRMRYQEFREDGLPIGSGMVEGGGCKALVGQRLKGPGMRWSRSGAQAMLALRSELFSNRWSEAWPLASPNFLN